MRSVKVYLNGELIKTTTQKQFSVWVNVTGLRAGPNTILVKAIDRNGNRDQAKQSFGRCALAVPSPNFTG
jgi:hypothetical protein